MRSVCGTTLGSCHSPEPRPLPCVWQRDLLLRPLNSSSSSSLFPPLFPTLRHLLTSRPLHRCLQTQTWQQKERGERRGDNLKALGQVTFTHTEKELNDVLWCRLGSADSVWACPFCPDLTYLLQDHSVLHTGLEKHLIKVNIAPNMSVYCYVYSLFQKVWFPPVQTHTNSSLDLHCGDYLNFVRSHVWPESNWEENNRKGSSSRPELRARDCVTDIYL